MVFIIIIDIIKKFHIFVLLVCIKAFYLSLSEYLCSLLFAKGEKSLLSFLSKTVNEEVSFKKKNVYLQVGSQFFAPDDLILNI